MYRAFRNCSRRNSEARHPLFPPRSTPPVQFHGKGHLRSEGVPLQEAVQGIRGCALLVICTYAVALFWTPLAAAALALDLTFASALHAYPDIELSKVLVFSRHLWYLSEQLVALALFDPDLPFGVRQARHGPSHRLADENEAPPRKSSVDIMNAALEIKFRHAVIKATFQNPRS